MPRLPAFLLLNCPPMSGSLHAGQRTGRRVARARAADRRHRGQPRVGIVLPFDLEAFGAHRREKPGAAGRREEPREIEDPHALQRERLVVQRRQPRVRDAARLGRHARAPRRFAQHRRRYPRPAVARAARPASSSCC